MKTKAKGLEATAVACYVIRVGVLDYGRYEWQMRIKGCGLCRSVRTYTTKRGAKLAVYRFAANLDISMESVEVVE